MIKDEVTVPYMWYVLNNHQEFTWSRKGVSFLIDPVLVDPESNSKNSDETKNTKLVYWAEVLIPEKLDTNHKYYQHYNYSSTEALCYDSYFDCSADTYEDVIKILYDKFVSKYGPYSYDYGAKIYDPGRSGVITYIKESLYNEENIGLDIKYLENKDNFVSALSYTLSVCSRNDSGQLYGLYKDYDMITNYDSDAIVNVGQNTYNIIKRKSTTYTPTEFNFAIKIVCRMFNINTLEFLYDDASRDFILLDFKFNGQ